MMQLLIEPEPSFAPQQSMVSINEMGSESPCREFRQRPDLTRLWRTPSKPLGAAHTVAWSCSRTSYVPCVCLVGAERHFMSVVAWGSSVRLFIMHLRMWHMYWLEGQRAQPRVSNDSRMSTLLQVCSSAMRQHFASSRQKSDLQPPTLLRCKPAMPHPSLHVLQPLLSNEIPQSPPQRFGSQVLPWTSEATRMTRKRDSIAAPEVTRTTHLRAGSGASGWCAPTGAAARCAVGRPAGWMALAAAG